MKRFALLPVVLSNRAASVSAINLKRVVRVFAGIQPNAIRKIDRRLLIHCAHSLNCRPPQTWIDRETFAFRGHG
ncbi:hypothetical protein ACQVRV_17040 (plasmid) [Ralstonia pseudosolanacearum]